MSEIKKYKDKDWLYDQYVNKLKSMDKIAKEINCDSGSIFYWIKKFKIPTRTPNEMQTGKNNNNWNNGQTIHRGYLLILKPDHNRANRNGYVRNSVLVMEKKLGRPIKKSEVIHHIDGYTLNDNPDNLYCYIDTATHHKKGHHSLDKCGYELYKKGIIKFENGEYRL